jgi:hypothetical protein
VETLKQFAQAFINKLSDVADYVVDEFQYYGIDISFLSRWAGSQRRELSQDPFDMLKQSFALGSKTENPLDALYPGAKARPKWTAHPNRLYQTSKSRLQQHLLTSLLTPLLTVLMARTPLQAPSRLWCLKLLHKMLRKRLCTVSFTWTELPWARPFPTRFIKGAFR